MTTARTWTSVEQRRDHGSVLPGEDHPVRDHGAGVKVVGPPPALQPGPGQPAEHEKSEAAGKCGEIDEQQRRAASRIADQLQAPGQARNDDDRKRDQADGAVDKDGIGRRAPSGAVARDQPEPHRIAADRGGQRLVEEGSNQVEAHRLARPQRRAAFGADLAPPQHADEDLQEGHGDGNADPAETRKIIDARCKLDEVDLAQRKVEQRRRDQYFYRRKQDPAHLARAS